MDSTSPLCGNIRQTSISFEWTISDFLNCIKSVGESMVSPEFFSDSKCEFKWRLKLYPHGREEWHEEYLSLYMQSINEFKVIALYSLSILTIINEEKCADLFESYQSEGSTRLIKRDELIKNLKKRFNDKLTIVCKIFSVTIVDAVDSKRENVMCNIIQDFSQLFENKDFCDIILIADSKEFPAHKAILAARSDVFTAMIKTGMIENERNRIEIEDISYETLTEMLRFIYTGKVKNLNVIAKDLLAAADKYAIQDLKNLCTIKLCQTIDINNIIDLLLFADLYSIESLKKKALRFIAINAKDIIQKPDFILLDNSHLLKEIVFAITLLEK